MTPPESSGTPEEDRAGPPVEPRGAELASTSAASAEALAATTDPVDGAATPPAVASSNAANLSADSVSDPSAPPPGEPPSAAARRQGAVRDILNDPVMQHMVSAAPLLQVDWTVGEALESIRACRESGRILYFYAIDPERRLRGVVAARKLLRSPLSERIRAIMSTHAVAIDSKATVLEACEFFAMHKFLAFPVVDSDRKIVGAVDVDLYTDELREIDRRQDGEDLFQLIGVHLADAAQGDARRAFLGRFPWLLCNLLGGMLSALIADAYQDVSTLAAVAPFIALVTALAESVSIQSVSLALQALHAQPPRWSGFLRSVGREFLVGAFLGGACGAIVGLVAWLWKGSFLVGASLALGIFGGVVASAGAGLSIPFILRLCRRDPQLASGPIALAIADVITLLFYFNLGRWLLGSVHP